jgi:hypothetical protein
VGCFRRPPRAQRSGDHRQSRELAAEWPALSAWLGGRPEERSHEEVQPHRDRRERRAYPIAPSRDEDRTPRNNVAWVSRSASIATQSYRREACWFQSALDDTNA